MPRQDVPYGGAICRLKERIAEIWDELGKKLHSINGVEGDGQGNVLIRSDSAALTITDDQLQHEIVLDLDTAQLPAAAVSSVNGQTGAVALTADDIPSDNGDVQTDLDNLEAADTTLQGNINAEALARANADSTLQTNINTVSAGIPAAAAAAVATDPTVAQLTTDVGQAQADIITLRNSAVLTTGNQAFGGIKTATGMLYGRLGWRGRLTGTSKIEMFRTPILNGAFRFFVEIDARYSGLYGRLNFASDSSGNISSVSKSGFNYGSDNYSTIYIYADNGQIIVGIGNRSSTNNYFNFIIKTGFIAAGNEIAIDYSYAGRSITSEVPATAATINLEV